ncbi:MAG: CoA activase, partial [Candidatus Sumerlaeota bacterium]
VSRPYNGCDSGLNMDLPKKLRALGVVPIPMDMLPLRDLELPKRWRRVYWRYGQRILKAAEIIKKNPNLFAVYVTNFSCGPDSFILEFFAREMKGKPYLQLEIDEHSADAGLVTRCEAFLDTLDALDDGHDRRVVHAVEQQADRQFTNHRTLYLPNMTPHAHAIASAMRAIGQQAEVMDESDAETIDLGRRYCSGRECYPCLLTSGDMIRQTKRPDFDRDKTAFFMASADGPCRFGQYNELHRQVLDRLGFEDVPIFTLDQGSDYRGKNNLSSRFERIAAKGVLAIDALEKLLLRTRPYEVNKGDTQAWFEQSIREICKSLEANNDGEFFDCLEKAVRNLRRVEMDPEKNCPKVGVVGEVYVRTNRFANDNIIEAIEELGGEVIVPTLGEWFRYVNIVRADFNLDTNRYLGFFRNWVSEKYVARVERKIYEAMGLEPDPEPRHLFKLAKPYLDKSFQGEAILTMGASVEYIVDHGAAGIVNTMPFTCMPGSICTALLRRVREDYDDIPVLNASFAGQKQLGGEVRLEAFMHQVKQFDERHSGAEV